MIKNLGQKDCIELLRNKYIGRLAYMVGKIPFVAPITYYFLDIENDGGIISYSLEGHKIDAMRKNRYVSLQVDEIESMDHWKSVLVHGEFEELHQIDAKHLLHEFSQGVKDLINRNPNKDVQFIHEFSSKLGAEGSSPIVYRINILEITGKQREG
ncbi:pyridoxamine 5'-phosphate oxidase family protein [Flagellimonas lutaonensis]|uniref:Pyridoxamine 5'-phosphate oxidase-related FMN-binding n=1 Tax=Flagellimonas lutaonensis TaxID=516051 RepID=A0A0D5YPM6_9FLAO|nr:pyridoxamine 5'-phosphate oxidase family protein [Allomuricauda lutaonensis]AKA34265.1 Pyridoxamine 5'-phosphate oxidase-related FMN-binding [Allomuricauda lutaonensis]